jgi:hypothetical protein
MPRGCNRRGGFACHAGWSVERKAARSGRRLGESGESAWRRRAGLKPTASNALHVLRGRRFTFWSAKKGTQKALFRCYPASRSQAKSLIKTGRLHPMKSIVPASPNTPSPINSVRAAPQEPPYPFCHALTLVLEGLPQVFGRSLGGKASVKTNCLPLF